MLISEILYRKNYFKKNADEELVDLTMSTIKFEKDPSILTYVIVNPDFVMRPDLISQSVYGNINMFDFILKFNGISNPFSINENDVLIIPVSSDIKELVINPRRDANDYNQLQKKFSVKPKTKKDSKRIELLKKKADKAREQLLNDVVLPPNINKPLDKNIKFKDGKIIFGDDVTTTNKANCPETLSRARIKEKLLNNKIFE